MVRTYAAQPQQQLQCALYTSLSLMLSGAVATKQFCLLNE